MSKKKNCKVDEKKYLKHIKAQKVLINDLWDELEQAYKNEDFFEALLKDLPQAIYFKDTKSQFFRVSNFMVRQLSQTSEKDFIGKTDFDFFKKNHASDAYQDEQEIMNTQRPIIDYEEKEDHSDGRITWVSTTKMPLFDKHGELMGTYGISRDITDTKNAKAESRAKELFLANMSHEIRTPINAIAGLARVLLKTSIDKDQKKYLDVINMSCDNLIMIVNDILDLSKLGVNKITLNPKDFKLSKSIESLVTGFEGSVLEKGISLRYDIDKNIPDILKGDIFRLNQILINLLSNAIKFTSEGFVSLTCTLVSKNDDANLIAFEVQDTGKGMKDTSSIFNQYEQEDSKVASEFGGTGLGLAICKELTRLFEGEIKVSSEFGIGSTFRVEIPFETGSEILPDEVDKTSDQGEKLIRGKRVLLVDDDDINRFVAETVLKGWGVEVHHAVNGQVCIDKLNEDTFDIVLMDMRMPVMDGLEATACIRNNLKSDIPIVAMTANAIEEERMKCFEAGMNDYISKPFDPDKLLGVIMKLTLKATSKSHKKSDYKPEKQDRLYSLNYLNNIFDNRVDLEDRVLIPFLNNTPKLLGDLKNSFEKNDVLKMKDIVHKLISSINILKVERLYIPIRGLEKDLLTDFDSSEVGKKIELVDLTLIAVMQQLSEELALH